MTGGLVQATGGGFNTTPHRNRVPMRERRREKFACCYEHQGQTEAPGGFPKVAIDESVKALTFYWGYFFRPILFQGGQMLFG